MNMNNPNSHKPDSAFDPEETIKSALSIAEDRMRFLESILVSGGMASVQQQTRESRGIDDYMEECEGLLLFLAGAGDALEENQKEKLHTLEQKFNVLESLVERKGGKLQ